VKELVKLNTQGRVHMVDGDNVEIFPGIRAYTGSRHTYASQYLRIDGNPPFVLASDSVGLYLNLSARLAGGTFSDADRAASIAQQARMIELAGSADRVVPGHDMLQFQKFPNTMPDPFPTADYDFETTQEFAPRFVKAFKHAAELCGAKPSPF